MVEVYSKYRRSARCAGPREHFYSDPVLSGAGRHGDVTAYDFEDDLVHGDMVRPDAEVLRVRRNGARDSLVRARLHYVPELLKSAENL